jgi:outer membrane receptor protein involved in Fe transport
MLVGAILFAWSSVLLAQDGSVIEEVIVTAQRVEENLQRVPVAASAFTDTMIDDRQIVGLADLQLNVPNLSYRDEPFARGRFIIRGVGRIASGGTVEDGVAVYVDGVPIPGEANFDFVDLERLEVMRGPQGTLYGRNATGGAVNMITRKPKTDALEGYVEAEYGDYEHRRLRGAVNLPINDRLAVRVAGMGLKRDGFTENMAAGQVEGIDDDMDGRDLWSTRITAKWWINDSWSLTMMHNHFEEDDDRLLAHALLCKQSPLPAEQCVRDEGGFDLPHPYAQAEGWFATFLGALNPGARDASTGLSFDFPRPDVDFRHQHTDFEPVYTRNEDVVTASLEWLGERFSFTLSGGHYDQELLFQHDERFDVGYTFPDTPFVPNGLWPTSSQPFGMGGLFTSDQCNINDGTAGVSGGCIWPADQTRNFTYNSQQLSYEQTSVEARLHSRLDGPVNFVVGGNYLTSERSFDFYRFMNVFDQLTLCCNVTPGFLNVHQRNYDFETYSAFGELYWHATDTLKLTAGLRYNNDAKSDETARQVFFQNIDVTGGADEPEYIRFQLFNWFLGAPPTPQQLALTDLYEATETINAAPFGSVERLRAFQLVPQASGFNELRNLTGVPTEKTWEGISARLGLSWTPIPDHLLYVFYSRGYKPGNFEVQGRKGSDQETVNTIELGAKMALDEGRMRANLAVFWNDYKGLQLPALTPELDQAIRELDAESWGAELEFQWHPAFLPGAQLNVAYSWLHSEVGSALAVDDSDLARGNPDYVVLRDPFQPVGFIARRDEVLPLVNQAVALGAATPLPNTVYPDGIPSLFSLGFLNVAGVETSIAGLTFDLEGNEIPSAPEHTFSVGLSYSWHLNAGTILARYDYYWQSKSFGRVHNSPLDRIDPWHQHNASLAYEAASGRWSIKAWVRNLTDEDNVNHREPSAFGGTPTSINDPRLFGATLRVSFGN